MLDDRGPYNRFHVPQGLEEIWLEEAKKKNDIAAATRRYIASQEVFRHVRACASAFAPSRARRFSLDGIP